MVCAEVWLFKPDIERLAERRDAKGLAKALRHADPDVRHGAALALAELGDPAAIPALLEAALRDPWSGDREGSDLDWFVRRAAARALATIGQPGVEALLEALASAKDAYAFRDAVVALGEIRHLPLL